MSDEVETRTLSIESLNGIKRDLGVVEKHWDAVKSYYNFARTEEFSESYDFIEKSNNFLKGKGIENERERVSILSITLYFLANMNDNEVLMDIKDNVKIEEGILGEILSWAEEFKVKYDDIHRRSTSLEIGNRRLKSFSYSIQMIIALKEQNKGLAVYTNSKPFKDNFDMPIPAAKCVFTVTQGEKESSFSFLATKDQLKNMDMVLKDIINYLEKISKYKLVEGGD